MTELMIATLVSYYHVSAETAEELISELSDLTSLQVLACGYRGAGGAEGPTAQRFSGHSV